ncbi:MAG TPA: type I restriction enzyme HsdR N-terminal domain-containing protein [Candidatus Hydrothermia bacterium]|nr:type I restriction enzyme HsdR N-terminal domain-containing protein [Candidatus Hydrothermia bacterium]
MTRKKQLELIGNNKDEALKVVPLGEVKCFITGRFRSDTPEERMHQDVARSLVRRHGFSKGDIDTRSSIRMGKAKKRVGFAIFNEGCEHSLENIYAIVKVKAENVKPSGRKEGIEQLKSYVVACINAQFVLWVGNKELVFKVIEERGGKKLEGIPDISEMGKTTISKPTCSSLAPAVNQKQVFKRVHNYILQIGDFKRIKLLKSC